MSPIDLAHSVGVTEGAVRQMESGQTKIASFPVGVRLAVVLGVEPLYLAFGDVEEKRPPKSIDRFAELERRVARLEKSLGRVTKAPSAGSTRRR
jgi:transcriptional regulator with XRE-family HTH domain